MPRHRLESEHCEVNNPDFTFAILPPPDPRLTVDPARFRYMYVTMPFVADIQGYRINFAFPPPVQITQNIFGAGFRPIGIGHAVLSNGRKAVYVADYQVNQINGFTIDQSSGALGNFQKPVFAATGTNPLHITVHPSNRFLYVTNQGSNDVSAYSISPFGDLVPLGAGVGTGRIPAGISPVGIAVNAGLAYVANTGSNDISEYRIDDNGMLQEIPLHSPVKAGNQPQRVAIHPNGRFVYVTNAVDNTVSQYTITDAAHAGTAPFGALVPMQPATVPSGISPVAVAIHPSGRFVYVANASDDTVTPYTVDENTGSLKKGFDVSLYQGLKPNDLAIDPSGKDLYVVCYNTSEIERHSIDVQNGGLLGGNVVPTPFANPALLTIVP